MNIRKRIWQLIRYSGLSCFLSDRMFSGIQYWAMLGKRLRLDPPVDFNEKVQWLKLFYRNPLLVTCADKWAVREYVKNRIGEKYLAECIGVYDDVDKIPFEDLPSKFVLKATHGSGWNIICPDKKLIDWNRAKKSMRRWLRSDFSRNGREWQYRKIVPRIICEKFIEDPETPTLRDYKLFTFKGETKYIWVDFTEPVAGRSLEEIRKEVGYAKPKISRGLARYRSFYDSTWKFVKGCGSLHPSKDSPYVRRPDCLAEMLEVARKLSSGFPHCRVDLYVIGGKKIIFGELTFSGGNGCNAIYPQSFNDELGSYIELPKEENNA